MPQSLATRCVFVLLLLTAVSSAQAAAGYGHFVIARRVIEAVETGRCKAPAELKEALEDSECRKAFCGGAVGPDICPERTHYHNTGDLANKMVASAHRELAQARLLKDPAWIKEAQVKLAFAYGWLSHCAADLNIHPLVNALSGDTYEHGGPVVQAKHVVVEMSLDAYLYNHYRKPDEKFDIRVPYDFLSEHVGVPEDELRSSTKKLVVLVMGELASKDWVVPENEDLITLFDAVTKNSFDLSNEFIEHPDRMQNWDLDCGPISTEDYRKLRSLVIEANDGTLPDGWGGDYLDLYQGDEDLIRKYKLEKYLKPPPEEAPDFNLPPPPRVHDEINDIDILQIRQWRDKCIAMLERQMQEDPLRAKNREECENLPRENREMTCQNCGFSGVHWWISPSWSCPKCEFCTMPQDVRRADGLTYREYAARRMKLYQDKMDEIRAQADKVLNAK